MSCRWGIAAMAASWLGCAAPDDAAFTITPGRTVAVHEADTAVLQVVVAGGTPELGVEGDPDDLLRLAVAGAGEAWTITVNPRCDVVQPYFGSDRRLVRLRVTAAGLAAAADVAIEVVDEAGSACAPAFVAWVGDCTTDPPTTTSTRLQLDTTTRGPQHVCVLPVLPDPSRPLASVELSLADPDLVAPSQLGERFDPSLVGAIDVVIDDVADWFRGRSILTATWRYADASLEPPGGTSFFELVAGQPGDAVIRPLEPASATELAVTRVPLRVSSYVEPSTLHCLQVTPHEGVDLQLVDQRVAAAGSPLCGAEAPRIEMRPRIGSPPTARIEVALERCDTTDCQGNPVVCCMTEPHRRVVHGAQRTLDVPITSPVENLAKASGLTGMACADIDGDGAPEVISFEPSRAIFRRNAAGRFAPGPGVEIAGPRGWVATAVASDPLRHDILGAFATGAPVRRFDPVGLDWVASSGGDAPRLEAIVAPLAEQVGSPALYLAGTSALTGPAALHLVCVAGQPGCVDQTLAGALPPPPPLSGQQSGELYAISAYARPNQQGAGLVMVTQPPGPIAAGSNTIRLRVVSMTWSEGFASLTGVINGKSFTFPGLVDEVHIAARGEAIYLVVRGNSTVGSVLLRFPTLDEDAVQIEPPGRATGVTVIDDRVIVATELGVWEMLEHETTVGTTVTWKVAGWRLHDPVIADQALAGLLPGADPSSTYGDRLSACASDTPSVIFEANRAALRWTELDLEVERMFVGGAP